MAVHNIICGGCGRVAQVRRSDTHFCYGCRLINEWDVGWVRDNPMPKVALTSDPAYAAVHKKDWRLAPYECIGCNHEFWPLRKSHRMCYYCTDPRSGFRHDETCGQCGKHNQLAPGAETICWDCVQASFKMRSHYILSIKKKIANLSREGVLESGDAGEEPVSQAKVGRPKKAPMRPAAQAPEL